MTKRIAAKKIARSMVKRILIRILILGLAFYGMKLGYAAVPASSLPAANLSIHLSGEAHDNRYFLCISSIGCFSVLAGDQGKKYPILHAFNVNDLYITDVSGLRVYDEKAPASCDKAIDVNQTLNVYGNIVKTSDNFVKVNHLYCTVTMQK